MVDPREEVEDQDQLETINNYPEDGGADIDDDLS